MTLLVTQSPDSVEATGHPTDCTEPVLGSVQGPSRSVTITDANGNTAPLATKQSTLHFDTHSHKYGDPDDDGTNECYDDHSHDLTGSDLDDTKLSSSITLNGEPVMVATDAVATDPVSGGDVNVLGGTNNSVEET